MSFLYIPMLTHITRCSTGSGHDAIVLNLRQTKIANHDLRVLIWTVVQQILRLRERERELKETQWPNYRLGYTGVNLIRIMLF